MIADRNGANQNVPAGEIIVSQGGKTSNLILLQKGKAHIFAAPVSDEDEIPLPPAYMYSVSAPAVIGCASVLLDSPYLYTARTSEASVISVYPSNREHLGKVFASNPNIGLVLLKSAGNHLFLAAKKIESARELSQKLKSMNAALSLAYSRIVPAFGSDDGGMDNSDPLLEFAKRVIHNFKESGGSLPNPVTQVFLSQYQYESEDDFLGALWEEDDLNFYRDFISIPGNILTAISQAKPAFLVAMADKMVRMGETVFRSLTDSYKESRNHIGFATSGDGSWADRISVQCEVYMSGNPSEGILRTAAEFLVKTIPGQLSIYTQFWQDKGVVLPQEKLAGITAFLQKKPQSTPVTVPPVSPPVAPVVSSSGMEGTEDGMKDSGGTEDFDDMEDTPVLPAQTGPLVERSFVTNPRAQEDTRDSARKIFNWAQMDDKFPEYSQLIQKLMAFENLMDADTEIRRVRRQLNGLFWDVFKKAIKRHLKTNEPFPQLLNMFFEYGYLDEKLLDEHQIVFLYENAGDHYQSRYPIHNVVDWLRLIYEKKVPTSINELGLTYFEIVKQENREAKWKKPTDLPADLDTPEIRLDFEIKNMIETNCRLTTGTPLNFFNILTRFQVNQNIENAYVSKKKLEASLEKLLAVDFSAFHREVLYEKPEIGIQREFIQYQVIPNFIIVPSAGTNFQHWQEREGKDRYSSGRLVTPALAMLDIYDMLLSAVGAYRWEMTKTLMGVDWNNVGKSSLTADYIDYIQFYKKSHDLSLEVKEKLASHFKRFRDDRSKFINDYKIWVKFESEGTQKLNKVTRKIFSKHCLFAKPIREELLKAPSFTEFIQKSINIRRKKAIALKPRYKKYQTDNGELPEELKETYRFFNGDY